VTLFKRSGEVISLPLMSKNEVAVKIIEEITSLFKDRDKNGDS
jgi:phosphopantothenoylcysteine decarboxylase/phosphopantothenate--cysteine ligase